MVQQLYKKSNGLVLAMLEKIWWSPKARFHLIKVAKIPSKERQKRDFLVEIGAVWSTRKIGKLLFSNPLTFMTNLELINKFNISQPKNPVFANRSKKMITDLGLFFIIDQVQSLKGRFRAILLFEFFR